MLRKVSGLCFYIIEVFCTLYAHRYLIEGGSCKERR